jgi:hypothetical protein
VDGQTTKGSSVTAENGAEVQAQKVEPREDAAKEPEDTPSAKHDETAESTPAVEEPAVVKDEPAPGAVEATFTIVEPLTSTIPEPTKAGANDAEPETSSTDKKSKKKKKKAKAVAETNEEDAVVVEEKSEEPARKEPEQEQGSVAVLVNETPKAAMQEDLTDTKEEPREPSNGKDFGLAETAMSAENLPEPKATSAKNLPGPKVENPISSKALVAAQDRIAALETEISALAHTQGQVTSLEETNAAHSSRIAELESQLARLDELEHLASEREREVSTLRRRLEEEVERAGDEAEQMRHERDEEVHRLEREVEERLERQRERERGLEMEVNRLKQVRSSRLPACWLLTPGDRKITRPLPQRKIARPN